MATFWKVVIGIWTLLWAALIWTVNFMASISPQDALDKYRLWWAVIEGYLGPNAEYWLIGFCVLMIAAPPLIWIVMGWKKKFFKKAQANEAEKQQPLKGGGIIMDRVQISHAKGHGVSAPKDMNLHMSDVDISHTGKSGVHLRDGKEDEGKTE